MRTRAVVAIGAVAGAVAILCAALNIGLVGTSSPADRLQVATATAHYIVDTPGRPIVHERAVPYSLTSLIRRTDLLAQVMVTPPVVERIARRAGIPPDAVAATTRTTSPVPRAFNEPNSERRASDIGSDRRAYFIVVQSRQTSAVLDVYTRAPTEEQARRLAAASSAGLLDFLADEAQRTRFTGKAPVYLEQVGRIVTRASGMRDRASVALLTFMLVLPLTCFGLWAIVALRQRRRGASSVLPGWARRARATAAGDDEVPRDDDWPHTTRLMPWTLAIFIAVVWLVPFNQIQLNVSLPIDPKFDRLVLPVVLAAWALALAAGGTLAPRIRLTWIHAAIAAFVAAAFASVVLSAHGLNQTGELDLSVKKLPLLLSYLSLFVVASSGVRHSEVRPFLTYSLVLAVICGLGLILEYRFKVNLFFEIPHRLLPGFFNVADPNSGFIDAVGRREVRGPAEVGLEAVTMMSFGLTIGLVGVLEEKRRRHRILYALAVCLIAAACFATFRKSALLAPASIFVTLLYHRRDQLVKLAPIGLVMIVIVQSLTPGALRSVTDQFLRKDRTAVSTVSLRTDDYDAIRPDVWTHPALGRGFGSYDHESYRILDNQVLLLLIETGVVGLALFLLVPLAVLAASRRAIASRDPTRAIAGLVGAASGVCFLVTSTFYDVLAFPHGVYIFLYLAGLTAVAAGSSGRARSSVPAHRSAGERNLGAAPPVPVAAGADGLVER